MSAPPTRRGPALTTPGPNHTTSTQCGHGDGTACAGCDGVQHRDSVADAWWSWGAPYRRDARTGRRRTGPVA